MNILDELQKKAEESEKRWKEIDGILNKMSADQTNIDELKKIVLLLVEQLRPMASVTEQTKNVKEELDKMFKSMGITDDK